MPGKDREELAVSAAPDAGTLEIQVLGPIEVVWDGELVDIGGDKSRALLARLLIDRNIVVSVDQLVDSLWGDNNARGARLALRSTVSRLRKRLQAAGVTQEVIVTRSPGYLLNAPEEITDASRFERLVSEGRRQLCQQYPSAAIRVLIEADELWRGPAYREIRDEPFARAEVRRLEELRLSATETRIDAELTLGHHQVLVSELETLTSAHPLRERLWSQRMFALYRSGRQAEALRVFQDLRNTLVTELGIEPGHDVAWVEHAILDKDPVLDLPVFVERRHDELLVPTPSRTPPGYRVRVPALPRDGRFVGRSRELATLADWWSAVDAGKGRLLLVDGDEGIGKTRLVAELARTVERDGALVLWGRCDEDPVAPFQPFAEALGRYYQSVSADQISHIPNWQLIELARLVVRLREYVSLAAAERANLEGDRFRFFEAVAATLNEFAAAGTILLVVDDLHWADQPTLLLLRHVLRNTDEASVGVIAMYADTDVPSDHPLRTLLADLRAVHAVEVVHLRGLGPEAVEELTREWTDAPSDLVSRLGRVTDGNPLFLEELLGQLRDRQEGLEGDPASSPPVSAELSPTEAIRELVARRVSRLPEDTIRLLQTASVAGAECEAEVVGEAAELTADRRLDAFDRAEMSRLLRRVGEEAEGRYAFSHTLVRDAIYGGLPRGRRARYHHLIGLALERVHADDLDTSLNELASHFSLGAAVGDPDKAVTYCREAGQRALHLLAFEDAVTYFARGLDVAERHCAQDLALRCDLQLALAEAQSRAGDAESAEANFDRTAALARTLDDAERFAASAVRRGPLSYVLGSRASFEEVELLVEARDRLADRDSHLRVMVTARLGLALLRVPGTPLPDDIARGLDLIEEATAMARRLGDRPALGYALNARMSGLWGVQPGAERLATAVELGEVAEEIGDGLLALHGHMWRLRELLVRCEMEAVQEEIARFERRDLGPVHPLEASFACNATAVMALMNGDFEAAEQAGQRAMEVAQGYNELVRPFYGALMWWTWWQRGELGSSMHGLLREAPAEFPGVRAAIALLHAEAGESEAAVAELQTLLDTGWDLRAADLTEGVSLAMAGAACSVVGEPAAELAVPFYEGMRSFAGTAIVVRAPAAACVGPADQYLGLLAATIGDLALAEVHFESALSMARRMESPPFVTAAEVELGRTLRRRRPEVEAQRAAVLLRAAEESSVAMGLHRLAQRAAEPG